MENLKLVELTHNEKLQTTGGFGPLYYAIVAAWGAGVAYGYISERYRI
ncbi:MAG TPA: hypothetical protein VF677_09810 [Flavobacterium sp.]|jgi:hypothetical protein